MDAAPERFELVTLAPLATADVRDTLAGETRHAAAVPDPDIDDLAHTVQILADGRPSYVRALLDTLATLRRGGGGDPISALAAALARGGELDSRCRFSYELRLHRARGYGALKAILDVLSEEEPLTLTQIAQRLGRTPGSTKDYLSWLQDVDLLTSHRKRYSFTDPLLRLWVRVHGHAVPADEARVAREAQDYAMKRLQMATPTSVVLAHDHANRVEAATAAVATGAAPTVQARPAPGAPAQAAAGSAGERALSRAAGAGSGIIEID
jgi:hypothetical protein